MRPLLTGLSLALVLVACERAADEPRESPVVRPQIREGGTERPSQLVVGLTPYLSEDALRREYGPLVKYLGEAVGIPAVIKRADSYADLSSLLTTYQVHVAILSPLAYVRAKRDNPGLILLATQIADGSPTYGAYIVTRDDTGFDSVESLAGKRFAYVDRNSASGYIYPLAFLSKHGHDPKTFFGKTAFVGNHELALYKVLDRSFDGGAVASTAFKIVRTEAGEGKRLKILAKTGRIPFDAYCASPRLDQELVDTLRQALLGLSTRTEVGRRVLRGLTAINGFVEVGDDHYDEVRDVARAIEGELGTP